MNPPGLTIGQLASHAGVTIRAIRHYHRRGLLAEPIRDASGYRRYNANAVVDLIRIKTMADAGVPLSRVQQLLGAQPAEFSAAVTQIDKALRQKIRELTQHRRALADLAEGDRLFLPPQIVDLIGQLRALGVSDRAVQIERDGWILGAAHLPPERVSEWATQKLTALSDPEFCRIYLACDEAFSWDPTDPRLDHLAESIATWSARHHPETAQTQDDMPAVLALMAADIAAESPAWRKLADLGHQQREPQRHAPTLTPAAPTLTE
jgi:DNA-binding transcriptional MerR regulator